MKVNKTDKKINKNYNKIIISVLFIIVLSILSKSYIYANNKDNNFKNNNFKINNLRKYSSNTVLLGANDRNAGKSKDTNNIRIGEYKPGTPSFKIYGIEQEKLTEPGYFYRLFTTRGDGYYENDLTNYDDTNIGNGYIEVNISQLTNNEVDSLEYGDFFEFFLKKPAGEDPGNYIAALSKSFRGFDSNTEELKSLIDEKDTIKTQNNYTKSLKQQKKAYDDAILSAENLYRKRSRQEPIRQNEVDQKVNAINLAKQALNGEQVQELKNQLTQAIIDADSFKQTPAYRQNNVYRQNRGDYKNEFDQAYNQAKTLQAKDLETDETVTISQFNSTIQNLNQRREKMQILFEARPNVSNIRHVHLISNVAIDGKIFELPITNGNYITQVLIGRERSGRFGTDDAGLPQIKVAKEGDSYIIRGNGQNLINYNGYNTRKFQIKFEKDGNVGHIETNEFRLYSRNNFSNGQIDKTILNDTKVTINEINNLQNVRNLDRSNYSVILYKSDGVTQITSDDQIDKDEPSFIIKITTKNPQQVNQQVKQITITATYPTELQRQALEELNQKLSEKQQEIDNVYASQNLKDQAKQNALQEKNNALQKLAESKEEQSVNQAKQNGLNQITQIVVEEDSNKQNKKDEANQSINQKLQEKLEEINNSYASQEDKDEAKRLASEEARKATESINNAKSPEEVDRIVSQGQNNINQVQTPSISSENQDKENAKREINEKLAEKIEEINNTYANQASRETALEEVRDKANQAILNITNSKTPSSLESAKSQGLESILNQRLPTSSTEQNTDINNAKTEIDKKLEEKLEEINSNYASESEKEQARQSANELANTAKSNIESAKSPEDIESIQNKAVEDISNVTAPSSNNKENDKQQAILEIDEALNQKEAEIDNIYQTESAKQEAKRNAQELANNAKRQIEEATTPEAIEQTKADSVSAINQIQLNELASSDTDKQQANSDIDEALRQKTEEINNTYLDESEKQEKIALINQKANTGKQQIQNAKSPESITSNKENAISQINGLTITPKQTEQTDKENAKREINSTLEEKIIQINNSYASQASKDKAIAQAREKASQAILNIENAKTPKDVNTEKENGISEINSVNTPASDDENNKKQDAKNIINKTLNQKIEEINNTYASQSDKENAIAQAREKASQAILNIENAKTPEAIETEKNNGINLINEVVVSSLDTQNQDKQTAKEKIAQKLQEKLIEINNTYTSEENKRISSQKANEEAQKAYSLIDNSKTPEALNDAKTNGINSINNISVTQLDTVENDKSSAKSEIDAKVNQKIEEINNSYAYQSQKDEAINSVKEHARIAKENIDNSKSPEDINNQKERGINNINSITIPSSSTETGEKQSAIEEIKQKLREKEQELQNTYASQTDKENALALVRQKAQVAIENINNSKTPEEVNSQKELGINEINSVILENINTEEQEKQTALNDIDNALNKKLEEINNNYATSKEKQNAILKAEEQARIAKENISNSKTPEDLSLNKQSGIDKISSIVIPNSNSEDTYKESAKEEINKKLLEKLENIDNTYSSESDKKIAKNKAKQAANNALNQIDNSKTPEDIQKQKEIGISSINEIIVPFKDTKNIDTENAINELLKKAKEKNKENKNSYLNDLDKEINNNKINNLIKLAKEDIKKSTTPEDIAKKIEKYSKKFDELKIKNNKTNSNIIFDLLVYIPTGFVILGSVLLILLVRKRNK